MSGFGAPPCTLEPNTTYASPLHYAERTGVADAVSCCAVCSKAAPKCVSWSFNPAKDGGACYLRPGAPTAREPKAGRRGEPCGVCGMGGAMIDLIDCEVCRHSLRLPTRSARGGRAAGAHAVSRGAARFEKKK